MREEMRRYHAFLLRLWPVKIRGQTVWRASLESAHTGERQGFADLDALCRYLRQQTVRIAGARVSAEERERRCEKAHLRTDFGNDGN